MERERGYSLHDFGALPSHRHDQSSDGLLTHARNAAGAPDSRIKRVLLTRKYKHSNVYSDIGIRVTGGKRLSHGELGAFVSAVNRSKAYEHLGEIKEGDQVLEWNGILLRNKTFEEVERIINSATGEIEVILKSHEGKRTRANRKRNENLYDNVSDVIARNSSYNVAGFSPKEAPPVPAHRPLDMETDPSPLRSRTHPTSTHHIRRHHRSEKDGHGYLQVAVSYDQLNYMLRVTCLSARSLKCRDYDGNVVLPNPFVKIYLLPGRTVSNKRRTKYISSTADPEWQQTVDYIIGYEELAGHYLEFTVWDYDKYNDDICLGMAVLNLQDTSIDGIPRWFPLKPPDHMSTARSNIPVAAAPSMYGNYGYNPANLDIGYPAIA